MSKLKNTIAGIIVALGIFAFVVVIVGLIIGLATLFVLGWNSFKG